VIAEREVTKAPAAVRAPQALAPWALRFFVNIEG
jgi:hypothetical protein